MTDEVVKRIYKERVPVDLSTDEEALIAAEVLGVGVMHRVFFLGMAEGECVFAYMPFPESGPVDFLARAARRKQSSYTFTGADYPATWHAAVAYAVEEARKEIALEYEAWE